MDVTVPKWVQKSLSSPNGIGFNKYRWLPLTFTRFQSQNVDFWWGAHPCQNHKIRYHQSTTWCVGHWQWPINSPYAYRSKTYHLFWIPWQIHHQIALFGCVWGASVPVWPAQLLLTSTCKMDVTVPKWVQKSLSSHNKEGFNKYKWLPLTFTRFQSPNVDFWGGAHPGKNHKNSYHKSTTWRDGHQ